MTFHTWRYSVCMRGSVSDSRLFLNTLHTDRKAGHWGNGLPQRADSVVNSLRKNQIIGNNIFYMANLQHFFSVPHQVGEDSWSGSEAQLRPGLPPPRRAGGGGLHQLLHLRHGLQRAVSRPHQLPDHVAPLVQGPVLQELHHVCRWGPETLVLNQTEGVFPSL